MKKMIAILACCFATLCVQANPLDELVAAMKAEQARSATSEKARPQGYSQSVVRGYLATKGGMTQVEASTSYLGFYATRSDVLAGVAQLGFAFSTTLDGKVDVYVARPGTQYAGFMVMSWLDTAGYASEIYLLNTKLP